MRIGILTAGGDCPGLNAVIRAAGRSLLENGHDAVGIQRGFRGLSERDIRSLDLPALSGILHLGGTILRSSSFDPLREPDGVETLRQTMEDEELGGVIAIGGEHTMAIARELYEQHDVPVIGVPKTIDNDVVGTDITFGFHTAVQIATDAIDRLHTTAQSHDRVIVVEVMGRNTGWIATFAGIAGGADGIVIPELELTVEQLAAAIESRHARGKDFSIIVVAEGAELVFENGERRKVEAATQDDQYGYPRLGGVGAALALELERATSYEARVTTLGHVQRGGTPTAFDRILSTRYGIQAAELVRNDQFGRMAALHGSGMTSVPLAEVDGFKTVDLHYLEIAKTFFG